MTRSLPKKFAVFDIDGTLIRWQLYHALADELVKRGAIKASEYDQVRMARMAWKQRTATDAFQAYEKALIGVFDTMLLTITVAEFEAAASTVFETYKDQAYTYTRELIRELKANGYQLFAISGSPEVIVEKVARYYGFDHWIGSHYETTATGTFSGKKNIAAKDKRRLLLRLMKQYGLKKRASVGVGDTESDIPMLELVERPIAMNPTKALFKHARKQGWRIVVERKNVTYTLEAQSGRYELV